jgi:hypothetical protein
MNESPTALPEPTSCEPSRGIDVRRERLIGLRQLAEHVPPLRKGHPVNPSTLFRWIHDGVKLDDGSVVRLEGLRLHGRWLSSLEALQRFLLAQTPTLDEPGPLPRTPTARRRASDRAAAELDRIGI